MEGARCSFWLPNKKRCCANTPLKHSQFCGNHIQRSDGQWIPCPIHPSHSVLQENLQSHLKRCPFYKQAQSLSLQPFYQQGINAGKDEQGGQNFSSEMKRNAVHGMTIIEFSQIVDKIKTVHASICKDNVRDSFKIPQACDIWTNRQVDRTLPFQEKHVMQQASILGNLEEFGVLKSCGDNAVSEPVKLETSVSDDDVPAVVEFGAGRGYLTQVLADCYAIKKILLVERKSYKLKADRSLRQKESVTLERLRIDIEDLKLNAVESLRGVPYLAIGKHLCGPATDKRYMLSMGISKDDFNAMTWFTSWAVDADHGSGLCGTDRSVDLQIRENEHVESDLNPYEVKDMVKNMKAVDRAVVGLMCKDIIDVGRFIWLKENGLQCELVKYVPSNISPENRLLVARQKD